MDPTRYMIAAHTHGCFVDTNFHTISKQQVAAGIIGTVGTIRPCFVFDLSAVKGHVTSVVLRVELDAYLSPALCETFSVFGVSLPVSAHGAEYLALSQALPNHAPDFTHCPIYGCATVQASDAGHVIALSLLPQAVEAIQAVVGGRFAVGITLQHATGEKVDPSYIKVLRFRLHAAGSTPQLIVITQSTCLTQAPHHTYGLQYEISDQTIPMAFRAIVSSQASALEAMLQSFKDSAHSLHRRSDLSDELRAAHLSGLAEETRQGLTDLAHKHVLVEQRIGEAHAKENHGTQLDAENTHLLQALERINNILHANISLARQYLVTIMAEHRH